MKAGELCECPSCKGTGGTTCVLGAMATILSVVYIPLLYMERNDPYGFTREPCRRCNGTGFIRVRAAP